LTRIKSQDAVVIGAGQAGVTLSYYLQQRQIDHVVFERDLPFSAWRSRWQGFVANTPNWMNQLPMLGQDRLPGESRNGFATREELMEYFEASLASFVPPLLTGIDVESVAQRDDGLWEVVAGDDVVITPNVAVCSGAMTLPRIPATASELPNSVTQLHSIAYHRPEQIATGAVLVVGSGSSGVQITELLGKSQRFSALHLAQSKVLELPKSVVGIPIHRLVHVFGFFDVRVGSPLGKIMFSNLETRGDPIVRPTPKELARVWGVRLHNRFVGASREGICFADGETIGIEDLTVLWCTGLAGDYSFIKARDRGATFDASGSPVHRRGVVTSAPGLSFLGLRYQHTVASHDIYGVVKDARYIADHIAARVGAAT
jgi:putative flavoprotein involved in K+ transport